MHYYSRLWSNLYTIAADFTQSVLVNLTVAAHHGVASIRNLHGLSRTVGIENNDD